MHNALFANAINRIPQKTPPIWFMRQAGRYHKHYQKLKEKYSFIELCKNPELAAETALGPVADFGFDVSILFSDLLFPLEAMGMGLEYKPGPVLSHKIQSLEDVSRLKDVDDALEGVAFQKTAVQLTRQVLPNDVSLIGFLGGPWTLYTYASVGKHEGNMAFSKAHPKITDAFYDKLMPLLKENLRLQIEGGAEVVMILDTSGGDLSPNLFQKYVANSLRELCALFPGRVGYYAKGSTADQLKLVADIPGLAGFGVDHRFELATLMKSKLSKGILQGNFDQSLLFLDKEDFRKELKAYIRPIQELTLEERAGWVSGLGHGILPATPEDNVREMIATIREVFQ
ncbi:MAG: uroporphyrinogen decarboxylase [Leptospira sp.]|nr:uroporphyrinogen decarboxylase [Leptospira sp.]